MTYNDSQFCSEEAQGIHHSRRLRLIPAAPLSMWASPHTPRPHLQVAVVAAETMSGPIFMATSLSPRPVTCKMYICNGTCQLRSTVVTLALEC